MEKFICFVKEYKAYLVGLFAILFIAIVQTCLILYLNKESETVVSNEPLNGAVKEEQEDEIKYFYVDIKGEVKKRGTYKLKEGKRVIDVVKMAGGLTAKADTSANNLSMKIKDEMVIVIYSKDEIKNFKIVKNEEKLVNDACNNEDIIKNDSCISGASSNKNASDNEKVDAKKDKDVKVSINNGTLEELMTLPGIGETKALKIIEYRKENKFLKLEDIKNVSGIGDALYEKIKDFITL